MSQQYQDVINRTLAGVSTGIKTTINSSLPTILWELDKKVEIEPSMTQYIVKYEDMLKTIDSELQEQDKLYKTIIENIDCEEQKRLTDDKKTKQQEIQDLKEQIEEIKTSLTKGKEDSIKRVVLSYEKKEKALMESHNNKYSSLLKEYEAMLLAIKTILDQYKITIPKDIESLGLSREELSTDTLWGLLRNIKEEIDGIMNSGENTITSIKGKINQLSTKKKVVGATVLGLGTALFAPAAILASGISIASMGKLTASKRENLEVLALSLVRIRKSILELAVQAKQDMEKKPSTEKIKKELESDLTDIKNAYQENIDELSLRNKSLLKRIENLESSEIEESIRELMQNKRQKEKSSYEMQTSALRTKRETGLAGLQKIKEKILQRNNSIVDIFNTTSEDLEKTIKGYKDSDGVKHLGSKQILNKFRKYSLLSRADIDEYTELSQEFKNMNPERYAQIKFDREVLKKEKEKLEKELEVYEKEGQDEEYWLNRYKEDNLRQNKVYIFDEKKLHLGELKTKYINLLSNNNSYESEQIFADNWDNGSVLFTYNADKEFTYVTNFVKYLIQQIASLLTPSNLQVNIISDTASVEFNDICVNTDTFDKFNRLVKNRNYISTIDPKDLSDSLKDIDIRIEKMQKSDLVGGSTFKELIREKRAIFSNTRPYVINVIILENDNPFLDLCKTSKNTGIINYIICRKDTIITKKENMEGKKVTKEKDKYQIQDNLRNKLKYCTAIVEVDNIEYDKGIIHFNEFVYSNNSCRLFKYNIRNREEINKCRDHLEERVKKSFGGASNLTITDFILDVIGDDLWSKCADTHVELYFGYLDGDMSKPFPVVLESDSKPHMFMGGTTGGGKSVTLSFMTNILKLMYSPRELIIYYFDFKVVEVGVHREPYKWTSAKALSGSKEPDYVQSLLNAVLDEMNTRNEKYFAQLGAKDFTGYRKKQRQKVKELIEQGYPERAKKVPYYPRIVVIIDEYVAGITEETKEFMKYSTEQITRLARSCGMNFIAVSQDPGGKIPANIFDLFAVRACTKATKEVSKEIMKSDFCGRQENQFLGFLGVNDSGTGDEGRNMQYLVPYTSEDDTKLITKLVYDKCMREDPSIIIDSVNYDDNTKFTIDDLNKYLADNPTNPGTIYLGEKVYFMEKFVPANVVLENGINQNMVLLSSRDSDKKSFLKSALSSIDDCESESKIIIMYSKDRYEEFNPNNFIKNVNSRALLQYEKIKGKSYREMVNKYPIDRELLQTYTPLTKDIEYRENINLKEMRNSGEEIFFEKTLEMTDTDYLAKPTSYSKHNTSEDKSFTGFMYNYFQSLINYQKSILEEVNFIKSDLPKLYLFIVDPEKDKHVTSERFFTNKDVVSAISNLGDYNIHLIMITSKGSIASAPIFNYITVLNSSADEISSLATTAKYLKNLGENMGKCINVISVDRSFKYKPILDIEREQLPWEVD